MRQTTNSRSQSLLFIALICCLSLLGCDQESTNQGENNTVDIDSHKVRSEAYIERGQFRPAMIEARNIIQKQPSSNEGYVLLARIYNVLGQGQPAIAVLENEAITDRDNEYWITLAHAYHLRGKYQSSEDLLNKQPELANTHQQQYFLLKAKNASVLGNIEDAKKSLRQVVAKSPGNVEAQLELIKIKLLEEWEEGQKELEQLITASPDNSEALLLKAKIAYQKGEVEQAEDIFTEVLSKLPTTDVMTPIRIEILNSLSVLLVKQGRTNEALVYTRLLSDAFPGASELKGQYEQAITLYKEGNLADSEKTLKGILAKAPNYETARQLLSIIKYLQGDFEESAAQFADNLDPETASIAAKHAFALSNMRLNKPEKVLEVLSIDIDRTDNPDTLSLYGAAALLSTSGEVQKGIDALRKALELDEKRTRIHLLLANYYNRQLPPEYSKALAELKQGYKVTPEDTSIKTALVQQLVIMKDIRQATEVVEDILSKQPDQAASQLLAGEFYFSQQQHEKAQKYYKNALEIDSQSVAGFSGIIKTAIRLEQWELAEQKTLELISKFPEQRVGYTALSTIYQAQGQPEKTFEKLTLMVVEENNATAAGLVASIYARNSDFEKAREFQQIAASLSPDSEAFKNLELLITIQESSNYLRDENYDKAREIALTGLNQYPDDERLITLITHAEIYSKNHNEAEKIIQQTAVGNAYLANKLNGDLSRDKGEYEDSLNYYNSAWKMEPSEELGTKIFTVLKSQDQDQRANDFLKTWVDRFPNSLRALIFQGDILLANSDHPGAIEALEKVTSLRPNLAGSLNNLAWAYSKVGNPKAEETAKKAYEIAPNNGAIADTYGWILYNQGKKSEAITILKRAAELLPDNEEIKQHLSTAMGDE